MANVFGALNRFISRLDSDQPQQTASSSAYGFQVLKNTNPGLPIDPWFDFIIGINGRNIDNADPTLFATEVRNCAGASLSLGIYSTKGQQIRELHVSVPAESPSLGLSLQWCPLTATEDVWHILDVTPNSPADLAGLIPYSDYVVGSPEGLLRGENGIAELVQDFMNRPLRLHVYNHEFDVTRIVEITPARGWGGDGALGCLLGFGALHRVPAPLAEPTQGPGETLFDMTGSAKPSPAMPARAFTPQASPSPALFVPADMLGSTTPSAPPPSATNKSGRKQKSHNHTTSPGKAMDEYFKEGEEKSRRLDPGSSSSTAKVVPPPPKSGAAPHPSPSTIIQDSSDVNSSALNEKTDQ